MLKLARLLRQKLRLGRAYVRGDYSGAIRAGLECLKIRPNDSSILVTMAECSLYRQDNESAIEYARRSLESEPNNFDAKKMLIKALFELKQYSDAYKHAHELLATLDQHRNGSVSEYRASLSKGAVGRKLAQSLDEIYNESEAGNTQFVAWASDFVCWWEKARSDNGVGEGFRPAPH